MHRQRRKPRRKAIDRTGITQREARNLLARVLRAVQVKAALAHAEAAHLPVRRRLDLAAAGLVGVRRELIIIKPGARHVLRVAVLLLPVAEDVGVLRVRGGFFLHGFLLLGDASGVV